MLPLVLKGISLRRDLLYVNVSRYASLGVSKLNSYPTLAIDFVLAALAFIGT